MTSLSSSFTEGEVEVRIATNQPVRSNQKVVDREAEAKAARKPEARNGNEIEAEVTALPVMTVQNGRIENVRLRVDHLKLMAVRSQEVDVLQVATFLEAAANRSTEDAIEAEVVIVITDEGGKDREVYDHVIEADRGQKAEVDAVIVIEASVVRETVKEATRTEVEVEATIKRALKLEVMTK